ncbi:DUF2339 domain-containing protein [Opitutus sp. ER46]|uniref:DUF2339 domain-containing protein n=1 Tax=Opitutus sp. ER46 TaxID=2161864 RepID=UPI0013047D85|nr:DUF2339 domain-containing protein [Opitutus sp. ER46]
MEPLVALVVLVLALAFVAFPVWAIIRILALGRENDALARRLLALESDLDTLRRSSRPVISSAPTATPSAVAPAPAPARVVSPPSIAVTPSPLPPATASTPSAAAPLPPPLLPAAASRAPVGSASPSRPVESLAETPEPAGAVPAARRNWEQFMGAKFFAWLGGLAALLALAFFVKYSFEHELIPPEVRVAIGFVFAVGLVVGGLRVPRDRYAVTAQTFIATGIVSLYAVTYACNGFYHFAFFGPVATFLLMALITTAAFLLAVRLEARVVAVLGILGGFLTPVLLSTGQDNPVGLFGYLAVLDAGLIAVALHRRWHFLVVLGAAGTIAMEVGWAIHFLTPEKAPVAMVVTLGFSALFFAGYAWARHRGQTSVALSGSAIALPFVALGFAFAFLDYASVSARPGLLLPFILGADLVLLAVAWRDERLPRVHLVAGLVVFALLGTWTTRRLTADLLPWALAFSLIYAALHSAFPLVLARRRPDAAPAWWSQLFAPLTLLLLVIPLFRLEPVSIGLWFAVLLVDLLALGIAVLSASVAVVAAVLLLTLGAAAVWLFHLSPVVPVAGEFLLVVGGFAVAFFAASVWLARRLGLGAADSSRLGAWLGGPRAQLPAFSALLPFVLLILVTFRLPLPNPSGVYGLALLLVGLTLGLAVLLAIDWLPLCALVGAAAVQFAWQTTQFTPLSALLTSTWALAFTAVFAAYPFVFRRRLAETTGPWAVAALGAMIHFPLVYRSVQAGWPNDVMGLLPAAFALLPLGSLVAVLRRPPTTPAARLNQLAWFGGATLLFVTLIFPIQFERQWLTVAWALEGAALLWLFHRVPHPGLRATGVVLLTIAFVRLALNPAVLSYHARSTTPLFNWYLYSYGLVLAALFTGARLLAPPRERVLGVNAPAVLSVLGTVLAFLLLNIQIADFFTAPGSHVLTFQFSGNFARDMSYTIGWALFALSLLLVGIARRLRPARLAALALLGVTALKLFLHDLARLDSLYRVGALFAVALVAIGASFAYQRFLPGNEKTPPRAP